MVRGLLDCNTRQRYVENSNGQSGTRKNNQKHTWTSRTCFLNHVIMMPYAVLKLAKFGPGTNKGLLLSNISSEGNACDAKFLNSDGALREESSCRGSNMRAPSPRD